ncbi:hypothetical protein E6C70_05990 [Glaciibacter flavus]|uniref:Asp23/Gls24 family envelope stress response protein n=1 Tax=Orlajensenia flava TaxID=2565934 RepID=A0A4S4FYQ4_9MICO|nr:hypothetical protein [Glaciibacter flavus]THG35588.1 hypothetical protein E6C70_05990 [Glaciibacter flavus]
MKANGTTPSLAGRVERVVTEHPGVRLLYSAQPVVLEAAVTALTGVLPDAVTSVVMVGGAVDRVVVTERPDGTGVRVSVGLWDDAPTAPTCRELHARIASELQSAGAAHPFDIFVRVASIG